MWVTRHILGGRSSDCSLPAKSWTPPAWRCSRRTSSMAKVAVRVSNAPPSPLSFCYSYLSTSPPHAGLPRLSLYFDLFAGLLLFSVLPTAEQKTMSHAHRDAGTHLHNRKRISITHTHTHLHPGLMPWYTWARCWRLWSTLANVEGRLGWSTSSPNDYFMSGWEEEQRGGGEAAPSPHLRCSSWKKGSFQSSSSPMILFQWISALMDRVYTWSQFGGTLR